MEWDDYSSEVDPFVSYGGEKLSLTETQPEAAPRHRQVTVRGTHKNRRTNDKQTKLSWKGHKVLFDLK